MRLPRLPLIRKFPNPKNYYDFPICFPVRSRFDSVGHYSRTSVHRRNELFPLGPSSSHAL